MRSAFAIFSAAKTSAVKSSSMVTRPANSWRLALRHSVNPARAMLRPSRSMIRAGPLSCVPMVAMPSAASACCVSAKPSMPWSSMWLLASDSTQPLGRNARRRERLGQERSGHGVAPAGGGAKRLADALHHRAFAIADHQISRGEQCAEPRVDDRRSAVGDRRNVADEDKPPGCGGLRRHQACSSRQEPVAFAAQRWLQQSRQPRQFVAKREIAHAPFYFPGRGGAMGLRATHWHGFVV